MHQQPSLRAKLILAFTLVYLIWGSTYLAIRYAIETLPPFLMAAGRFCVGGAVLFSWGWFKGARPAGMKAWGSAMIIGFCLLLIGNGGVVIAEQWVASGLAALLIATTPLWISLFEWMLPDGKRPSAQIAAGILMGFGGVVVLIDLGDIRGEGGIDPIGAAILIFASMSWSIGSLYGRTVKLSNSPIMTSGMQMICGGVLLALASLIRGEPRTFDLQSVSAASAIAFFYLMIFGSIVAFTAYSWLVTATTPARLATYAYVNPAVAVFLGWAIAAEPLTGRMLMAMLVVVGGVIVITNAKQ
jgi:drug/metabolite transporter (DMT)-like permease